MHAQCRAEMPRVVAPRMAARPLDLIFRFLSTPPWMHDMNGISFPSRITRRIATFGMSALALAVLAACSGGHAEEAGMPPAPQVSAAPVLVKQVSQWDEFSGRVEAVQSVELRPRVSGYIDKVNY